MRCPNCEHEVPEGKKFCGYCGHALDPAEIQVPTPQEGFDEDAETQLLPLERELVETPSPRPIPEMPKEAPAEDPVISKPTPKPSPTESPAIKTKPSHRKVPGWVWILGVLLVAAIGWGLSSETDSESTSSTSNMPTSAPTSASISTDHPTQVPELTEPPLAIDPSGWETVEVSLDGIGRNEVLASGAGNFYFFADFKLVEESNRSDGITFYVLSEQDGFVGELTLLLDVGEYLIIMGNFEELWEDIRLDAPILDGELGGHNWVEIQFIDDQLYYTLNGADLGVYPFPVQNRQMDIEVLPAFGSEYDITYAMEGF